MQTSYMAPAGQRRSMGDLADVAAVELRLGEATATGSIQLTDLLVQAE